VEDHITGLEMLTVDTGFERDLGLRELRRKQEMQQPIGRDPNLRLRPGIFIK
jgi:hypothetical protein